MPGLVAQSSSTSQSKRILQDSTSSRRNEQASPSKRRKLEDGANKFVKPARRDVNGGLVGSSQPKSQFETEVLEKRRSEKRPEMGIFRSRMTVRNQDGVPVMTFISTGLVSTRPAGLGGAEAEVEAHPS